MAKKPKLYRCQFLISKPCGKYEKVKGISGIHFYLAYSENEVKDHMSEVLEKIRSSNNDESIYLKTLNIKLQRMDGVFNLINNKNQNDE